MICRTPGGQAFLPACFFGLEAVVRPLLRANWYSGNGSSSMVKTIAEQSGVKVTSFSGYVA